MAPHHSHAEVWEDFIGLSFFDGLMSQSRVRRQNKPPQPIKWWQVALGSTVFLVAVAGLVGMINWFHSLPSNYDTATGKILEIRKVADGTRDTLYGGKIRYRIEAHVQYVVAGKMEDRWLRTGDDSQPEGLTLKLAAHPTECVVYWLPNHPENAKCSLK